MLKQDRQIAWSYKQDYKSLYKLNKDMNKFYKSLVHNINHATNQRDSIKLLEYSQLDKK
jgi:hypothetical protein